MDWIGEQSQKILGSDLGGSTFERIPAGNQGTVLSKFWQQAGNNRLGGDDFDQKIMDWIVSEYKKDSGIDLSKDNAAMQRLKRGGGKGQDRLVRRDADQHQPPFSRWMPPDRSIWI